jgi:SAM-dependent methyltransferase
METVDQHNREIHSNLQFWRSKPVLRRIYKTFHELIARNLATQTSGVTIELGAGIGTIKEVIPHCILSDLFPNPWIDCVQNTYCLSLADGSVTNLILFDVFHHLQYPGAALEEFHRVLIPGGRVIIFEPCVSILGRLVYGLFHLEPLGLRDAIQWMPPDEWSPRDVDYYAAQGNATRIFLRGEFQSGLSKWTVVTKRRFSAISYVTSGGYSGPQLYPSFALPIMRLADRMCDLIPWLFATRLLLVIEKKTTAEPEGASDALLYT